MKLDPIVCSQCGAPLQVPADVNFVTCNHCHASLAVKREASVTYTEAVQKLASHTEALREEVAELRYERELERIDREWRQRQEDFMVTTRRGNKSLPTRAGGIVMIVVGLLIGGMISTVFFAVASGMGDRGGLFAIMPCFGLLFTGVAVFAGITMLSKTSEYERARAAYESRRAAVRRNDFGEKDSA
jgi:hypothetical protein